MMTYKILITTVVFSSGGNGASPHIATEVVDFDIPEFAELAICKVNEQKQTCGYIYQQKAIKLF